MQLDGHMIYDIMNRKANYASNAPAPINEKKCPRLSNMLAESEVFETRRTLKHFASESDHKQKISRRTSNTLIASRPASAIFFSFFLCGD